MNGPNLHTVYMYGGILCVRCEACRHRAALDGDRLPHLDGNMTTLRSLKFACRCGAKAAALYIPMNRGEADSFVAGGDIEQRRR